MDANSRSERIEAEASLWAARLRSGSMSEADRRSLARWLDADPDHRWVLGRYRELSGRIDVRPGSTTTSSSLAPARHDTVRRGRRVVGVVLAAAAVLAVALVTSYRPRRLDTHLAERHVAALPDGSRIELNAQTSLAVAFRGGERRVRLDRGEAWFSVAKDPARPFVVETPAGVVRVTGTVFNVRAARGDQVEVTVLEGTVRLRTERSGGSDTALTRGLQGVMASGQVSVHELPVSAVQDAIAWRTGQAIFEDTSLREALERFGAYHGRRLEVDAGAAELRLGGRYSLDDLDGLLQAIERVLPVKVMRTRERVRITASPAPAGGKN